MSLQADALRLGQPRSLQAADAGWAGENTDEATLDDLHSGPCVQGEQGHSRLSSEAIEVIALLTQHGWVTLPEGKVGCVFA